MSDAKFIFGHKVHLSSMFQKDVKRK